MLNIIPAKGFIFWPVGNGDSTTIKVADEAFIQVDLNHLSKSEEEDDPHFQIIDELREILPEIDNKPHLSLFILTHPDEDHCKGFASLLKVVTIGEIWFSPRIFREYKKDLCDDAIAFKKEAKRRIRKVIENDGDVGSGDLIRIIGYDDLLNEEEFDGFPDSLLVVPGHEISEFDNTVFNNTFRAFIHAPFKEDSYGDRNNASLALQITLRDSGGIGKLLLFGDHACPTLKNIFERSEPSDLEWNVFLAPHHCSKKVMYWKNKEEDEEELKNDILENIEKQQANPGYIISSSEPIPSSNEPSDNPPHAIAKHRYQEIVNNGFLCTQEHPNEEKPVPIIFEVNKDGFNYLKPADDESDEDEDDKGLMAAVTGARGSNEPPKEQVGFGICSLQTGNN